MQNIISASRRTDLPAFHMMETYDAFVRGYAEMINPFTMETSKVDLKPENVSCIVWWSKDYNEYLANKKYLNFFLRYNQIFQFTINGYLNSKFQLILEPGVNNDLWKRLDQVAMLAYIFSPEQVLWRFDPIVFWNDCDGYHDNLHDFEAISKKIGSIGVKRCQIAFGDMYAKFTKRVFNRYGNKIVFFEVPIEKKLEIAKNIAKTNKRNGITTYSCAHSEIVNAECGIFKSSCIDADLIEELFSDVNVTHAKDKVQRKDCGCVASKDIGSYEQNCDHNCIYCYANPNKV
jgi:hypothetical protein